MEMNLVVESGIQTIVMRHRGQVMRWDARPYKWGNPVENGQIFNPINDYWSRLPAERQDAIWACYIKVNQSFHTAAGLSELNAALTDDIAALYQQMPYDEFAYWLQFKSDYKVPTSMLSEMPASAITEDVQLRTYLRHDYVELLAMAVALRPMLPIWSEYLYTTKKDIPGTFKEHIAFGLIGRTYLVELDAMARLMTFIECSLAKIQQSSSAIIGGLGTAELPEWVRSGIVVKRVAVATLTPIDDKKHVVAEVYKYLNNAITTMDRKFSGHIKDKEPHGSGNEEDNMSIAEIIKVKEEESIGDTVIIEAFAKQYLDMATALHPDIAIDRVSTCVQSAIETPIEIRDKFHITVAQYVLARVLSPDGIEYLTEIEQKAILGLTQAILWHEEQYELAALITASPMETETVSVLSNADAKLPIDKVIVEQLMVKFPWYINEAGKKSERQLNPALKVIDIIAKEVGSCDWILNCPQELIRRTTRGTKRYTIQGDFKNHLGRLILNNC